MLFLLPKTKEPQKRFREAHSQGSEAPTVINTEETT